jgi:integrase
MASVWTITRATAAGEKRYRVRYRLGGRESRDRYGGSFRTQREALERKRWIAGELAAMRVPDLTKLLAEPPKAPTLTVAAERWRASRVDVAEGTAVLHRVALDRVLPVLGKWCVDEITPADIADLVAKLTADGYKRETIRKSITALAQVLDFGGISPNPARDRVQVRLPREERSEIEPPTAAHVEAVIRLLAPAYRLPVLVLDATGMRVGELERLRWGDIDEAKERWRVSRSVEKTRRGRWVPVPDDLFAAVLALRPREDRDPQARVFPDVTADRLRVAIGRACKVAGVPAFSPHDLRHRRISLWHRHGVSWAQIGQWVGQRSLSVTADTYTHVLSDDRELDRADVSELLRG